MKAIKRSVCMLLAVLMMALTLVGCAKKTECEICGQTKKCTKVTVEGESAWVCKDCKALVDLFMSMAG